LLWFMCPFPPVFVYPGYSPGQGHRQCQAEPGEAEPHHCLDPGAPNYSSAVSRWLLGFPRADLGLNPAKAASYLPGTAAAHRLHLWG
jgi:hypothetical protein